MSCVQTLRASPLERGLQNLESRFAGEFAKQHGAHICTAHICNFRTLSHRNQIPNTLEVCAVPELAANRTARGARACMKAKTQEYHPVGRPQDMNACTRAGRHGNGCNTVVLYDDSLCCQAYLNLSPKIMPLPCAHGKRLQTSKKADDWAGFKSLPSKSSAPTPKSCLLDELCCKRMVPP